MLSFSEFRRLILEGIQFVPGRDDDYYYDNYSLITFNRNDIKNYRIEGKTAGVESHACKHLDEIDKDFVDNIITQVKNTLIEYVNSGNYPKNYEFNIFTSSNRFDKEASQSPLKAINTAPREAVINFLDLVNDKVLTNKPLAPIEKKMTKFLDTMGNRYQEYIDKVVKEAKTLDSTKYPNEIKQLIKSSPIVKFGVRGNRSNKDMIIYLDFAYGTLTIRELDGVHTCFKVDGNFATKEGFIQKIMARFGRQWFFLNRSLFQVLRSI